MTWSTPTYPTFFELAQLGESIPSDAPIPFALPDVLAILDRLREGDFMGILDPQENTLQVACQEGLRYHVEVPVPAQRCSYMAMMGFGQLVALFESLPERFTPEFLPMLSTRAPW